MHISFDLDGTIIDSLESIKNSFQIALEKNEVEIKKEIIIYSPLDHLLTTHLGDEENLKKLVKNSFIKEYDENFATTAIFYSGIERVLRNLKKSDNIISLVTNKRKVPTFKILGKYNAIDLFDIIVCSDEFDFGTTKFERLHSLRVKDRKNFYIGDTQADCVAATKANYRFLGAGWGYDDLTNCIIMNKPQEILENING